MFSNVPFLVVSLSHKALRIWAKGEPIALSSSKGYNWSFHMVTLPGGREESHLLSWPLLWCPVGYEAVRKKKYPSKGRGKVLELPDSLGGFLGSILEEKSIHLERGTEHSHSCLMMNFTGEVTGTEIYKVPFNHTPKTSTNTSTAPEPGPKLLVVSEYLFLFQMNSWIAANTWGHKLNA